jgi:hypothetical protein
MINENIKKIIIIEHVKAKNKFSTMKAEFDEIKLQKKGFRIQIICNCVSHRGPNTGKRNRTTTITSKLVWIDETQYFL